ncbi:MAG: TIGR01244 family sulfur transferase [Burkholderiaceae bacterium]
MELHRFTNNLSISGQIDATDLEALAARGFRSVICNRPDGESVDQPGHAEIQQACEAIGLAFHYLPAESGKVTDEQGRKFGEQLSRLPGPVLAYCRTGLRSATMWALHSAESQTMPTILATAQAAGYDLKAVIRRISNGGKMPTQVVDATHDVVIVGGGAAGMAVASSLLARDPTLDVAVIEPAPIHYYQPGWTLVGAGVFEPSVTARTMASVIPSGLKWIQAAVAAFEPENNSLLLEGCRIVRYAQLIVCPGLKVDWEGIEGLAETIGHNGVTSNYRYDLAPYTWQLIRQMRSGRALFTQPPMPIKCAGAPQKAMYLSADHWRRSGVLGNIDVSFHNAGGVLFGVAAYVPALMAYVERYNIDLHFNERLTAVDGQRKRATFEVKNGHDTQVEEREFDMIHVVPPQTAPDFIRVSPLADASGWVDVDKDTLRHVRYDNVFGLGDAANTPNAKTAAAVRKQAPVVANNLLVTRGKAQSDVSYDGYGSCPLTVERGKIVLAEFGYGGKLTPTFPKWIIDGEQPSRLAWLLKERLLPPMYWRGMLRGREWLAGPKAPA